MVLGSGGAKVTMVGCGMESKKNYVLNFKGRKLGLRRNKSNELEVINKALFSRIIEEDALFELNKSIAFLHFGKCGGVYINRYLINNVLLNQNYSLNNSWRKYNSESKSLGRDYTEKELIEIKNSQSQKWRERSSYVHNHHNSWSEQTVLKYNKAGWLTFMFIREPKDLICSLYFFAKDMIKSVNETPIGPNGVLAGYQHHEAFVPLNPNKLTLDEFMVKMLSSEQQIFWKLPGYADQISYLKELNPTNFETFLYKYFRHRYKPEQHVNKSSNKGYRFYRENGLISKETEGKFNSHPEYAKYLKYLD